MQAIVALLFRVAYAPLLRVVTAALVPALSGFALDPAQTANIFKKVGSELQGLPIVFAPMGMYTAAQEQEIVEGTSDIVVAVIKDFGITDVELHKQIGKLLADVALKVV